ncbi:cell division protein ZipA C-terminal FtsZ-binding domain-containing protein [Glaciimonas sp. Gout2]|uniref:cell division protein ZipA C-terminal FtsZ-binding domain-containing protein n=2 Tax=Glaciimonas TaxID=1229970 RepID=UPI002AB49898|nr:MULTISPECIES: cell division protein ZipA C-terminal FtsZ-binding domain-containing protein [unclassified Glaciimonas]MDY7548872.1 cell division protein ZipA C-terminal FtsZ-binding domain-containing protein [Glaciimonas sp. CA11.2]MEB0012518.1 cell division protein ZipA C-terminal FtsZ-binding domain-containing protein [Glaciimonas sp. Cout2]MEB0084132.1 cell division protein ZipA C-terminal FtsZ-binding domain-containing protein [Glaciimonas sp. Gout2]
MTDLQTSLFVIGGVIIVGVVSYNKWQEYKAKKSVERAFSTSHDDVLMTPPAAPSERSERHEPVLFTPEATPDGSVPYDIPQDNIELTAEQLAIEPQGQMTAPSAAEEVAGLEAVMVKTVAPPQIELPVDGLIDCVIPLSLEAPVRGDKILPVLQNLRYVGNKPVNYIGEDSHGEWEPIAHGGIYKSLMAGVQMANRSNPLNEIEYSELVISLRQICDDLGAEPDIPDMTEVMQGARALHQFVIEHDAQLGVNIQSKGAPWAVTTLMSALTRQGFDARPEGRLIMSDGDGGVLFSLSINASATSETTARLTLLLDVPRVSQSRDGYGAMVACARSLASRLSGVVVDDSNQPLADMQLSEIAGQVDAFYLDMDGAEIPAGSTRALRLFS